jgi:peroxiredoxin
VTQAYGLWREERGYGRRAVIVVGADGHVSHSQVIERGAPDVEAVLAAVRAAAG